MQRSYGATAWALLRRRFPHILYVGGAMFTIDFLRIWPQVPADADLLGWITTEFAADQIMFAAIVVVMVTLAQAVPVHGWRRALVMAAAGPVAIGMISAAAWLTFRYFEWNFLLRENIVSSFASHAMSISWGWWVVSVGLSFFYLAQEREARLAREAREAELVRVEAQRTVMATRLDVMRARVEPEFLFGALAEVRKLYQENRVAGDEMIDALIVYLRAALPQIRGQGSTVQREVDLAGAYAAVLQVPRGDALSLSRSVEEDLREIPLAPMVLLPLAQAAFEGSDAGLRTRFAIDAA
ncbi:MAG: histidine kinase, partial [Burkholderiales bacterium]